MKPFTKLKIGLVLDDSLDRNDGVQQYVRILGGWLAEQNHEVHYLVGESSQDARNVHSLARNVSVRFNGNRLTMPLPGSGTELRDLLAREKFDVLHIQMPYSPFMAGKVIRAASPKTAVVGTFHILPFGRLQKVGSKLLAAAQTATLRRFDAVCSVSEPAALFAKQTFGMESEVVPCLVDTAKLQTSETPRPGQIVFLGRLVERKGVRELLEAIDHMPGEQKKRLDIVIAGDGPERPRLESYAAEHNLSVNFLGYVPEKDKAALLASAELAVFPATGGESFGIVLIEAMAAGAGVVVGGNNPGYASVLGDWPEVLVDPKNSKLFADVLEKLLSGKELASVLHEKQQQAVKKYDVKTVGNQIVGLYKSAQLHRQQEMR